MRYHRHCVCVMQFHRNKKVFVAQELPNERRHLTTVAAIVLAAILGLPMTLRATGTGGLTMAPG